LGKKYQYFTEGEVNMPTKRYEIKVETGGEKNALVRKEGKKTTKNLT